MQSCLQKTYQKVLERVSDIVGEPSELENRLALCMGLYSPQTAYALAHSAYSADSAQGPAYVAFANKGKKGKRRGKGRNRRPKRKSSGSKPGN